MADRLRWYRDNEVVEDLQADLAMMRETVSQNRKNICAQTIGDALEDISGSGEMIGWAAVAIRRKADGSTETYVCGDPSSTDLEIKGYLHSAVWEAAHNSEGLAL